MTFEDATSAVANVDDYSGSAQLLAATTLRNVLGTRNLGDILADREAIAHEMQSGLDEATDSWGVLVERVEVGENVLRYICFWLFCSGIQGCPEVLIRNGP